MNWDALGAIAESLGAIGVIATLAYLAVQVRQSKQATEANTRSVLLQSGRDVSFHLSELYREWSRDPELMKVFNKSIQVPMPEYTPEEQNQLNFFLKSYFHSVEALYVSQELGLGFKAQDESYLKAARTTLASWPAWRTFWDLEVASGIWPPGLVAELARDDVGSLEGIDAGGGEAKKGGS